MNDLQAIIDCLDEEIRRTKTWVNTNGFHHGTAMSVIVRRYRDDLKKYRKLVRDDLHEDGITDYSELDTYHKAASSIPKEDDVTPYWGDTHMGTIVFIIGSRRMGHVRPVDDIWNAQDYATKTVSQHGSKIEAQTALLSRIATTTPN